MVLTDDEIAAVAVGGAERHDGPIELLAYDPAWPERYRREEARVRCGLGQRALRLEHIGSTSVPGLAAKPCIDMVLVVADSSDEPAYVPALEAAGYVLCIREPGWHQHRMFRTPDARVNLHVYSDGCPEIDRVLLFRDRLRRVPEERELYERTKRELAQREWRFVQNYADAKSAVIEAIIARGR